MNADAVRPLPSRFAAARASSALRPGPTRFGLVSIALAVLCIGWTWTAGTISAPNERVRVFLSMALVDRGEVAIDAEIRRFGRVIDLAEREGHFYSDKAPGSSFLGAVPYAAARLLGVPVDDFKAQDMLTLMRNGLMLPVSLAGGLVLYLLLLRRRIRETSALLACLLWMLSTPAFHYGGAFYGHHIAAVFLLVGLYFIEAPEASLAKSLAAGLFIGFSVLTEYQAAPASVLLGLWALYLWRKQPLYVVSFGLGAGVCALVLMAYNHAAFGSPFALSYTHVTNAAFVHNHDHGIGGIDLPKAEAIKGLLFSRKRGLFVTAPALLLIFPGIVALFRSRAESSVAPSGKQRAYALLLGAIVVCQVLIIAGFDAWWGGWSFGPRLLLPAFGIAMVLIAYALQVMQAFWAKGLVLAACLVGFIQVQTMEATMFEVPETLLNPWLEVGLYGLKANLCSPSLGNYLGLASCWGALPGMLIGLALLGMAWVRYAGFGSHFEPRALTASSHAWLAAALGLCLTALALAVLSQPAASTKQAQRFQRSLPRFVDQAGR